MAKLSLDLSDELIVFTGGAGTLGSAMAQRLLACGARVILLSRNQEKLEQVAADFRNAIAGAQVETLATNVTDQAALENALQQIQQNWGTPTTLINAAGGNQAGATVMPAADLFATEPAAWRKVIDLNLMGTILPSIVFGGAMAALDRPTQIINISSMAAARPLTRVGGYAASKAAVDSFTAWLAIELAQRYEGRIRVNAIAPGFFIAEQNRALLTNPDGSYTQRGQQVIDQTPMKRFGEPEELQGVLLWLLSEDAAFVTGTVIAVDGGFGCFAGV
ncbi:MAG: SDR family oxidoreductase [Bacteroidota bacterium]